MRVWIDMTASAHVLVFRPLIEILRERGDEVEITARDYAQTLQLLELHGLEADAVIGQHGGRSRTGKARAMWLAARARCAAGRKGRDFDVALAHGSHELTMTARRLGIPSSTTFDYEWAWLQHQLGCRAATKVVVPDAIPPERLARYGAKPPKLVQYEGLKEEYYLADFEPDRRVLDAVRRSTRRACSSCSARRRTSRSTTGTRTRSSRRRSSSVGTRDDVHAFVLPRTEEQREFVRSLDLPSVIVPERAVDAQSLIALADLVVSAGGTMNREAAALGVPVLHDLRRPARRRRRGADPRRPARAADRPARARAPQARRRRTPRVRRDPQRMLDLLLEAC